MAADLLLRPRVPSKLIADVRQTNEAAARNFPPIPALSAETASKASGSVSSGVS
jgi:hypothetical protein